MIVGCAPLHPTYMKNTTSDVVKILLFRWDCKKNNYNVIAKEERLKQSLDLKGFKIDCFAYARNDN